MGDFTIDFGPLAGGIILLLITLLLLKMTQCNSPSIGVHNLLAVYMVASVCVPGGMSLYNLADAGGLKVIMFFFIFIILKNNVVVIKDNTN